MLVLKQEIFVNRPPKKTEVDFFLPYLKKELEIIQPDMIVTLGNVPLKAVTGDDNSSIGDMHGVMTKTKDGYVCIFPSGLSACVHPLLHIYAVFPYSPCAPAPIVFGSSSHNR